MQRYPALRTTFIRREVRALRDMGIAIRVFSMRPPREDEIRVDPELLEHARTTHLLPRNPMSITSILANACSAMTSPMTTLQNLRLAFDDPGERGVKPRVRLALQVWRGAVLARMIRRIGPCARIHAHFADGAATTALAAARLLGVPFSFTSHTSHVSSALKTKLRGADQIICISEYDRARLRAQAPTAAGKMQVVHCGIPLDEWNFEPAGAIAKPTRIVSVGGLVATKGHDDLICACDLLRRRGRDIRCRIIGEGAQRAALARLIEQRKLDAIVELVGAASQEQVRRELRDADLFVLACKRADDGDTEGLPVSLMEAMALGRPVVSCGISAVPELIRDGHSGLLAPPGDPDALADAIERIIARDVPLHDMLQAARRQIERHFDASREAEKIARLLCGAAAEELVACPCD